MELDAEKLLQKYQNVAREEIEEIRRTNQHHGLCETIIESTVCTLHTLRRCEMMNGKESILVGPLIHLLSLKFLPDYQDAFPILGRISTKFRDETGKMVVHDAQVHGLDCNGFLKLTYPQSSWPLTCMPLHDTRFVVDLSVWGKTLDKTCISCEDDGTDFEQVIQKNVPTDIGAFSLRYIVMPFAIYGHVQVKFYQKRDYKLQGKNHGFLDIKGKIIACYGNTYEDCTSEGYTLFDKESDDFERVDFEQQEYPLRGVGINLSRCWVGLPVYSSLIVDMDLREFGSGRKLVKEVLEFRAENKYFSYKNFIVDDILIKVDVKWNSPMPQDKSNVKERGIESENESSDEEMSIQGTSKGNSDDEQMIESDAPEASSSLMRPWLGVHRKRLFPISLVEVYSIYIGRDKFRALQIYGSVEISTLGNTYYCFNRETSDAFRLLDGSKTIPLLDDGSLVYDDCDSLKMKIDLKDVESSLCIKGYVNWDDRTLEFGTRWFNKPLCSFVKGQHGFAAIYYSFFPQAVKASLMVVCAPKQKTGETFKVFPRVYGSIIAHHDYFDYTSRYNKDNFRVALFQRNAENPIQTSADGVITLSRSMFVLPLDSTLVVGLNLSMSVGDSQVSFNSSVDLRIGTSDFSVESENKDYSILINVKWVD